MGQSTRWQTKERKTQRDRKIVKNERGDGLFLLFMAENVTFY